jgi:NitT/TauT family transport system substrate-binding protein
MGTHRTVSIALALPLLVLAVALTGCGGGDDAAPEEPAGVQQEQEEEEPAELKKIDYATSFGLFGRDAYAYVALEQGFFEEAGFDVSIVPGNGSLDNAKLVASGRLDYAPVDFSALVVARANEGIPLKGVTFVHRQTLSAIFAKEGSGIERPQDLEGKTIGDVPGSTIKIMFPLYAEKAGFDPSGARFRPANAPSLPSLLASGRVDAVGQFVVGEPLFEKATQGDIVVLPYAQFLEELPGIVIVTTDDRVESDPEEVERFVGALNRGLEFAVNNPQEAAEIMNKHQPDVNVEIATQELERMREFVLPPGGTALGFIDAPTLETAIGIVGQAFDLETPVTLEDVYAARFTGDS